MKALTVATGTADSARLDDVTEPVPEENEVCAVGAWDMCRTSRDDDGHSCR